VSGSNARVLLRGGSTYGFELVRGSWRVVS
jgi:hypothetical protein